MPSPVDPSPDQQLKDRLVEVTFQLSFLENELRLLDATSTDSPEEKALRQKAIEQTLARVRNQHTELLYALWKLRMGHK